MDAKGGGITLTPPKAASADVASVKIGRGRPKVAEAEVASVLIFFGRGIGILVTAEEELPCALRAGEACLNHH